MAFVLMGCGPAVASTPASAQDAPSKAQVVRLIADFEAGKPEVRPLGILKYLLDGRPLYLIPSPCCDQFNFLYTPEGRAVCAPSGGITGAGDGKCPPGIQPAPARAAGKP